MTQATIYTVSRLNTVARLLLEQELGLVWLTAEISNLIQHSSGHWYLTLKDAQAQVKAAMFKGQNRRVSFQPQNGQQVLIQAQVSLYEARGDYQLIIEKMQPAGDGLLQMKLEALKEKLTQEGLFALNRKKAIPESPQTVGIITSPTGAAIHDMIQVIGRRNPNLKIILYPTQVQGESGISSLAQTLKIASERAECDVYIIGRGGGSLEDLWCFNEEQVVRLVANFPLPIISAVGHETDVTLTDFAADLRAPTPSAAAEIVSPDQSALMQSIQQLEHRLKLALKAVIQNQQLQLNRLTSKLNTENPRYQLQQKNQLRDELASRLEQAIHVRLTKAQTQLQHEDLRLNKSSPINQIQNQKSLLIQLNHQLKQLMRHHLKHSQANHAELCGQLNAMSPLSVLSRGYSVTTNQKGKVITSIQQLAPDEQLKIQLSQGSVEVMTKRLFTD